MTGTTGRPKGATISHSSLVVQSRAKIAIVGYGEDDVCLFFLEQLNWLFIPPHKENALKIEKSLPGRW